MNNEQPQFEITRSFSMTKQVKQYEPISIFMSAKESFYEMPSHKEKLEKAEELYQLCKSKVEGEIFQYGFKKVDKEKEMDARAEVDVEIANGEYNQNG